MKNLKGRSNDRTENGKELNQQSCMFSNVGAAVASCLSSCGYSSESLTGRCLSA
jgi:hypothetical protein